MDLFTGKEVLREELEGQCYYDRTNPEEYTGTECVSDSTPTRVDPRPRGGKERECLGTYFPNPVPAQS